VVATNERGARVLTCPHNMRALGTVSIEKAIRCALGEPIGDQQVWLPAERYRRQAFLNLPVDKDT
jgi:hypothetical protein